jgi:DNA-binding GntR family transcriptional regulator
VTLLQESALAQAAPLLRGLRRNEELPGEMAIADHAGVGRTVVRGLLRNLGRSGFIARRNRRWVLKRPLPAPLEGRADRVARPRSKKDLVKEHLLAELTGGCLRPGQRIVELAVARALGVSTAVVREALLELRPLGAFLKKERSHWQVVSIDEKQLQALREFREMVELFALRRLFQQQRLPHAEAFDRNRRRTEELLASQRVTRREILDVDLEFHRLLLEASGNPLLLERASFVYLIIEFQLVSPRFRIAGHKFGLRQHMRIHRALEKGRHDLAETALRRHLQAADENFCAIARCVRNH